ncbi:MAG: heme ABC transporter ATP-binding protein [Pseudomonadota bacterium]
MALIARDIEVFYGKTPALHGVDFTAQPGQVTAIIGPNGSGKSTLLKAMTAELAYRGQVTLDGVNIQAEDPALLAARRAVLPQSVVLTFPFSAREVVEVGLTSGLSGFRRDLPMEALARVELAEFADRFYQELSGGQQQRVQFARVLAQVWEPVADGQPCWLLLDEPVSSLDIAHQVAIMRIAKDYARRGGGVVAVMHDLNLTAHFADQTCLMKEGRVVRQGATSEVLQPETLSPVYDCRLMAIPAHEGHPAMLSPDLSQVHAQ